MLAEKARCSTSGLRCMSNSFGRANTSGLRLAAPRSVITAWSLCTGRPFPRRRSPALVSPVGPQGCPSPLGPAEHRTGPYAADIAGPRNAQVTIFGGVMPRTAAGRSTAAEANLAARVANERHWRGWKQATLARRMSEHGCPMQGSTIYKIEAGSRNVSIDELVGFSGVFGIEPSKLLLPMSLVMERRGVEIVKEAQVALRQLSAAITALISAKIKLIDVQLRSKPEAESGIAATVQEWMPSLMISYPMGDEDDPSTRDPVGDAWGAPATSAQPSKYGASSVWRRGESNSQPPPCKGEPWGVGSRW